MELDIYGKDGKSTGKKAKLNDAVFGIEPNDHAIWLDVKTANCAGGCASRRTKLCSARASSCADPTGSRAW